MTLAEQILRDEISKDEILKGEILKDEIEKRSFEMNYEKVGIYKKQMAGFIFHSIWERSQGVPIPLNENWRRR